MCSKEVQSLTTKNADFGDYSANRWFNKNQCTQVLEKSIGRLGVDRFFKASNVLVKNGRPLDGSSVAGLLFF
jgi:hypothetical protein